MRAALWYPCSRARRRCILACMRAGGARTQAQCDRYTRTKRGRPCQPARWRRILACMRAGGARTQAQCDRYTRTARGCSARLRIGGVSSLACAPEARAPMNLNGARASRPREHPLGARASRPRRVSEGKIRTHPGAMRPLNPDGARASLPACALEAYPRWHARQRRAHP